MPRKSKKKLLELTQTDGKNETFQPTTIMQIMGDTGITKYGTLDLNVYTNKIKEMNLSDLQSHALKIGMIPSIGRERLEKQLLMKFSQWVSQYSKPVNKAAIQAKDLNQEKYKKALDILSAVK